MSFRTYDWSVSVYRAIWGAKHNPMTPLMPQPSSSTEEPGLSTSCANKGEDGDEIHSAKRGVTFHRTGKR